MGVVRPYVSGNDIHLSLQYHTAHYRSVLSLSRDFLALCVGFVWQGFGSRGGYRGGFCEKLLEASPVSDRANASRL